MKETPEIARRDFLKNAAGATAVLATGPAILAQRNPNSTLGVACVGVGTRGHELLRQVQDVPGTEIRVICDLYTANIQRAKDLAKNTNAKVIKEWEKAVTDPDIDVVIKPLPISGTRLWWSAPREPGRTSTSRRG